ncbi:hypothetical protein [Paenibacillus sp. N3.4]|uniref:hypothetical protein n=1 Tax=Paenibacillus sp. N3.4 TaxID=2603222 RepID=UPI00164FD226|nr:hypothetical protein [Paenibacillus sp. N3.4]
MNLSKQGYCLLGSVIQLPLAANDILQIYADTGSAEAVFNRTAAGMLRGKNINIYCGREVTVAEPFLNFLHVHIISQ